MTYDFNVTSCQSVGHKAPATSLRLTALGPFALATTYILIALLALHERVICLF
jgi:hypothetical protein